MAGPNRRREEIRFRTLKRAKAELSVVSRQRRQQVLGSNLDVAGSYAVEPDHVR